jgi:hypothetical protein
LLNGFWPSLPRIEADTHCYDDVFMPFPRSCGKGFFIFLRAAFQLTEVNTFAK